MAELDAAGPALTAADTSRQGDTACARPSFKLENGCPKAPSMRPDATIVGAYALHTRHKACSLGSSRCKLRYACLRKHKE